MFKKAMNTFFDYSPLTRFLALTVACAVIFAGYMCIFCNLLDSFIPQDAVYTHFNQLATEVIQRNSVHFLENSEILNYYTVTENSLTNTITVTFVGFHTEKLELVLSTNYTLVELNRPNEGIIFAIAQFFSFIIVFGACGIIGSLIINSVLSLSKWLYDCWIKNFLNNCRSKINFKKISFKKKANGGKYAAQNPDPESVYHPEPEIDEDDAYENEGNVENNYENNLY